MSSLHQMTPLLPAGPSGWTPKNPDGDDVHYEHRHGVPLDRASSRPAYATFRAEGSRTEPPRKKANPPRPPNPFILFRNDYTKRHARGGPKVRRNAHSGPLEDSHSKRAGQAWRALTAEEKRPWQLLAKKAGEEHAKMYPDYRYRPNKRPPASALRRHQQRLPTSFCRTSSNERSHSETTRSASPPSDYDHSSLPTSPSTSQSASPPLLVPSEARFIYRRSTSVPTSQQPQPSTSTAMVEGEGGSDLSSKRRSRSLHEGDSFYPTFPFADASASNTDLNYYQQCYYAADSPSDESASYYSPPPLYTPAATFSPLPSASSSLAGWNGEPMQCAQQPQWCADSPASIYDSYSQPQDASWGGLYPDTVMLDPIMQQHADQAYGVFSAYSPSDMEGSYC